MVLPQTSSDPASNDARRLPPPTFEWAAEAEAERRVKIRRATTLEGVRRGGLVVEWSGRVGERRVEAKEGGSDNDDEPQYPVVAFDEITSAISLSDGRLRSIARRSSVDNYVIDLSSLVSALNRQIYYLHLIRSIDVSRCHLVDADLLLLSEVVIQQLGGVESVNASGNWFLYHYSDAHRTNPVIKAVRQMLTWNIAIDLSETAFATPVYLALFPLEERRFLNTGGSGAK